MKTLFSSRSFSRRSLWAMLLVGVLTGLTLGSGVVAIAALQNKIVTVCANKKTNMLRYAKNGICLRTEIKVVLNQSGAKGVAGAKGATGVAGATGAVGMTGGSGATGAKGDLGGSGASGSQGNAGGTGTNGTNGVDGAPGVNAAFAPTVAGASCIATKCTYKVGDTGPGGGIIFFVDYNDQYTSLNYLEAAPMGWGNGIAVNQGGLSGETTGSATVDPIMKWCSNTNLLLGVDGWGKSAVGTGASNSATADTTCTGGAIQVAVNYAGGGVTDWFLPSVGEAMLMYANLRQAGVGTFASDDYWSSSENIAATAWFQNFSVGSQVTTNKSTVGSVRPVRAF